MSTILDPDTEVDLTWAWPLPALGDVRPTVVEADRVRVELDRSPHAVLGYDLARAPGAGSTRTGYGVPGSVPVLAASGGRVRSTAGTGRGQAVIIDHRSGRATYYAPLSAVSVARGELVRVGQPIGLAGAAGDAPSARLLRFEFWPQGTRSTARAPSDYLDAWPILRFRAVGAARNVAWLGVKTPGLILNEMRITNEDVSALGRDVYATFRRPWEAEFDKARARFKVQHGRDPGVGRDSDPKAEWATVYASMSPPSSAVDSQWKAYQGAFVHSWGEFERDWGRWYLENMNWRARMWRGTYDQALDYRKKAKAWREQFQALGGTPSSPAPEIPKETGPLGDVPWSKIVLAAGGIAAAVFVLPPVIAAVRK